MSGPASPGQQVCTGRRARSTSLPSQTISWQGADCALLRRHVQHLLEQRQLVLQASASPSAARAPSGRRAACRPRAARRPILAHAQRDARRRAEQVAEHRHARAPPAPPKPFGFSNSSAGPPAFSTRSQISVISSRGSTSARDALQLAARSSCARKSRRSAYFMLRNRVGVAIDPSAQFTVASLRRLAAPTPRYRARPPARAHSVPRCRGPVPATRVACAACPDSSIASANSATVARAPSRGRGSKGHRAAPGLHSALGLGCPRPVLEKSGDVMVRAVREVEQRSRQCADAIRRCLADDAWRALLQVIH